MISDIVDDSLVQKKKSDGMDQIRKSWGFFLVQKHCLGISGEFA